MELNSNNFDKKVLSTENQVLVDFWGSWCIPCKQMEPIVKKLSQELDISVFKINVNQNPTISNQENILGVPTFIFYNKGKQVDRLVGAQTLDSLKNFVKKNTKKRRPK